VNDIVNLADGLEFIFKRLFGNFLGIKKRKNEPRQIAELNPKLIISLVLQVTLNLSHRPVNKLKGPYFIIRDVTN